MNTSFFCCDGKKLLNFTERGINAYDHYVWEYFLKQDRDFFHAGLNSDCHIFTFPKTVCTEEQIKAHRDFFLTGYNFDADPVALRSQATMKLV